MKLQEKVDFINKNINILPKEIIEKINKAFDIDFTYNSTTIEGNTLTLIETKAVLEDNITIGGKELREIYEVINHNKAFNYIKRCIDNKEILNEKSIKDMHEILVENIMQGGIYRATDVIITGTKHTPPTPNEMYNQLRFFYEELQENIKKMDALELAAWTHAEFVKIHPFIDGNGRTSRLIMNYQLMINNYLPISIKVEDRLEYYKVLDLYATTGELKPFIELIQNLEEQRLDEIIKIIKQQMEVIK
ncbi:MAG: Fic family protein [Clostridiales bacterium]|nr:Fic family protein [Clostridiales bacterium]